MKETGGWGEIRLGDVAQIKHGWPFKSECFCEWSPGLPVVVSIGNFQYTGGFRFETTQLKGYRSEYPKDYDLSPGDILLVMTCQTAGGEILGIPGRIPNDGIQYLHNQRMGKVVVTCPDLLDLDYLYWVFLWNEFNQELVASSSGTKIVHTAPTRIEAFRFLRPPLEEQRAIARILRSLDDKIQLNRRMNRTLETMSQALFRSWFVDFEPVSTKREGRKPFGMDDATADLFPEHFQETDMGPIPLGWNISTIGMITDVTDCLHSKKPDRLTSGKPLLQLNNIRDDGLLDSSDWFLISEGDYEKWISRMEAQQGDCVITNVGRVGAVSQIPPGIKAALGRNMTGIRCKASHFFPTFLIECLLSDAMRDEIVQKTDAGTILDALNVKNIPLLRLVLPARPVLEAFEKRIRPVRAKIEHNFKASLILGNLRDTLLPQLLSGELRVRQAEKMMEEVV